VRLNRGGAARVELAKMIRRGVLAMVALLLLAAPAWAAGDKATTPLPFMTAPGTTVVPRPATTVLPASTPFVAATQPFPASRAVSDPLPASVLARPERRHHRPTTTIVGVPAAEPQVIVVQQPVYYPQIVAAAPSECVTPGYWSYRWIPYTTTQNVWVPGSWAADGSWIDSRWEPRPYSSGYYEPFWIPAQSC
jgi:hypothetical protein